MLDILQKILFEILCKFIREKNKIFLFIFFSVPEDQICTSVILDGATYQRLSNASRTRPKLVREQEIEESKRSRDTVEVGFAFYSNFKIKFFIFI